MPAAADDQGFLNGLQFRVETPDFLRLDLNIRVEGFFADRTAVEEEDQRLFATPLVGRRRRYVHGHAPVHTVEVDDNGMGAGRQLLVQSSRQGDLEIQPQFWPHHRR